MNLKKSWLVLKIKIFGFFLHTKIEDSHLSSPVTMRIQKNQNSRDIQDSLHHLNLLVGDVPWDSKRSLDLKLDENLGGQLVISLHYNVENAMQ